MADYVVRVEAATSQAEEKLRKVEKQIGNISKDVKVNIQLPNINQVTSALKEITSVSYEIGKVVVDIGRKLNVGPFAVLNDIEEVLGKVANGAQRTASAFSLLAKASPQRILVTAFDSAVGAAERLSQKTAQLGYVFFGLTQSVNVLKGAFSGFFDETIGREIRLRESLLRTKTTLISTADVVRNGARLTDPMEALKALDKPIEDTLQNIRRRSLDIAGTTSDAIVQVFGVVASQIGAIGGSIKDAEDLAITFAGALGTIGMADPMLANQEIRSILTGNIDQNSVLARSLGITNEDIQKAKRSSEGLVAFLTKRLEGFVAGQKLAAQGFAGIVSNISEVREEVSRSFGAGLLDPLLDGLTTIYTRLQLVFDQLISISSVSGKAIGTVVSLIGEAGAQAPTINLITESVQTKVFDDLKQEVDQLSAYAVQQALNLEGLVSRLINNIASGLAQLGQGIAALAAGFAYFKFEQFKITLTTFTNIAGVLNATVIPALNTLLNLYGQFLQLPVVNYLNQIAATHQVLDRIGVNAIVRLAATWSFYQQSINIAIGWVKKAISFIKGAITGTINFIADTVSGAGAAFENVFGFIVRAATRVAITVTRVVEAAIQGIGVLLARLARTIKAAFPGSAIAAGVATALRGISREFLNIDKSIRVAQRNIGNFSNEMIQALSGVEQKAAQTAQQIRGIGGVIATKLGTALQGLAGKIGSAIVGLVKFQVYLALLEYGTSAVVEAFGRYQRAQEQATNSKRVNEAIRRLGTVYKDLGDDIDYATKRRRDFESQLVDSQYTSNEEELEKLQKKLGEIRKLRQEIAQPGIQSWGELSNFILPDFMTGIEIAIEDLQKLEKAFFSLGNATDDASNLFKFGIEQFMQPINAFNDMVGDVFGSIMDAIPDFLKSWQWLTDGIGNAVKELIYKVIPGARLLGYFVDLRDRISQRNEQKTQGRIKEVEDEQNRIAALRDREQQAANIALAQKARTEGLKELKEYERQLDGQLFQERQSLAQKEVDLYKSAETFRIDQIAKANRKRIEGEEGASEAALSALTEWISTKQKADVEAQTIEKNLRIELDNLERSTADYRYEVEKRIAQIRMRAAQYDASVRAGAGATTPEGGSGQFRVGSTGSSTGPHLHLDGPDPEKVVAEAAQIIQAWQGMNLAHIQLSNTGVDVKNMRDMTQLLGALRREQQAHSGRSSNNGIDIAVPSGTPVPVMTGPIQNGNDARGYYATSLATGNRMLHGLAPARTGNPADLAIASGAGSYWEGYMKRLSNLEGGYGINGSAARNPSSDARGYFQLLPSTETDLRRRGKGALADQMLSSDFRTAAMGAWGYMQELGPSVRDMMHKGDTAGLDRMLNRRWPSLPGGSQAGSGARLAEANAYLANRSGSAAAPAAPVLPPALPEVALGDLDKIQNDTISTRERLANLMKRQADLQKQINEANTAEQFEQIAKTLFPKVGLEQYDNQLLELKKTLEVVSQYSALAFDPDRLKIAVEYATQRAIAERELKQYLEGIAKLTGITEQWRKKAEDNAKKGLKEKLADLEKEKNKKLEILNVEKQQAAILQVAADTRKVLADTQTQILDAGFAARGAMLPEDDFQGRRRLAAEQSIARYRLQLEQQGVGGAQLEEALKKFAEASYASADALAELDERAADLGERLRYAKESASILTDGYKGMLSTIMQGGDIREAVQEMGRNVASKFTDMMLDYAFKPIEQQLEKQFRDFFKVDDAQSKNTTAVKDLTLKIEALTAAITKLTPPEGGQAPGAPGQPSAPGTTPPGSAPPATSEASQAVASGADAAAESQAKLANSLNQTAETAKKSAESQTKSGDMAAEGMQKAAMGIATVATSALSIVGGIQSIKKGGAYNVLSGIGSIFMGLGSGLSGLNGMGLFGGAKATGGPVSAKTPYLVGERGPELFVPNGYGNITPNNRLREAMGSAPGSRQERMALDLKFESRVINGVEYISRDQLNDAMEQTRRRASADGAKRGMSMTLDKLQQSPSTRSRIGIR